jgi:acetyl esterase
MALDEAPAAPAAQAAARWGRRLHQMSVAEARELCQARTAGRPAISIVRDERVSCAGGSIPVRVFAPDGNPQAVIVFYHAGGWALGSLAESDAFSETLARRTGCAVISTGYRLAPEYRFPTAVQDAWMALRWAAAHLGDVAAARVPLIVAGEGAGGNLAAVVARWSVERSGPSVDAQILLCPVTDCDFDSLSYTDAANQLLLDRDAMMWFWDMYAPDAGARRHPDASPLRAVFLTGLPPAIVVTAEHDVVRDEGELYAMRLVQAGVPVEHRRFAGQMHAFAGLMTAPGSEEGIDFIAAAIDRRIEQAVRA